MKTTTLTGGTTYRYSIFASLGNTNTNGTADNSSTYRLIPTTLSASTIDPIGRLDVGYHYNGSVVYTTDVFGNITTVCNTVYNVETVLMTESNTNFIGNDVVSGAWNSNTLVDQSMVLYNNGYGYSTSSALFDGCGYHVPNTPINNQLVTGVYYSVLSKPWPGVASLAVSPFDNTIVGGVVYTDQDSTSSYYNNHVRIYKYVSDTGGWALLGLYDIISTQTGMQDLALSVGQDSNVWATWGFTTELYAARVSLSASSATLPSNLLISNWNGDAAAGGHAISMTYDPQSIDTANGRYGIRLVFLDDTTGGSNPQLRSSPLQVQRSVVSLQYSSPVYGKPVTESGGTASNNARIVYNPWFTNAAPAYEDFAGAYDGYVRAYDLVTASNETWEKDSNFGPKEISIGSAQMDLTYEVTGSKFVTWATSNTLTSNRGNIATFFNTASLVGYPRITTNTRNQRDLLVSWSDGYNLDNSGNAEQALFVQELYP